MIDVSLAEITWLHDHCSRGLLFVYLRLCTLCMACVDQEWSDMQATETEARTVRVRVLFRGHSTAIPVSAQDTWATFAL